METRSSVHLTVDTDILKKFNSISKDIGKSRNQIMNELLIEWLEDMEDIRLAERAMAEIEADKQAGKKSTMSLEEVEAYLAKED